MQQISVEPLIAAIVIIGISVMLRVIRLQAALLLIGIVVVIFAFLPSFGSYTQHIPSWLFWVIVVILGINLLRGVLGILFGRSAADHVTGRLLYDIFTPIFKIIGGLLRAIFRIR